MRVKATPINPPKINDNESISCTFGDLSEIEIEPKANAFFPSLMERIIELAGRIYMNAS